MHTVILDRAQADLVDQVGKRAQHHVPVLDDIAHPGRGAGIVFEDAERALLVANDVGAANVDVGVVRNFDPLHLWPPIGVTEDKIRRDDPILQDVLAVIEVGEQ